MKTSPEDITVLLVGGGSIVSPESLAGVGEIIRPPFFGVANAVGAAMAKGTQFGAQFVLPCTHCCAL